MDRDEVSVVNAALTYLGQPLLTLQPGESFTTFTPKNNAHAYARTQWDPTRRQVLSKHPWKFATLKETLEPSDYVPIEAKWNVSYKYPANCLKFLRIVDVFASVGSIGKLFPDARSRDTITIEQVERDSGIARPGAGALIAPDGFSLNEIATEVHGWLRRWEVRSRFTDEGRLEKVILTNLPDGVGEYVIDVPDPYMWSQTFETALTWLLASRIGYAISGKAQEAARAFAFYKAELDTAEAHDAQESNDRRTERADWLQARTRRS